MRDDSPEVRRAAGRAPGVVRLADEDPDRVHRYPAVRVSEHLVEVDVVLRLGHRVSDVVAALRRDLAPVLRGRRLVITVEDYE